MRAFAPVSLLLALAALAAPARAAGTCDDDAPALCRRQRLSIAAGPTFNASSGVYDTTGWGAGAEAAYQLFFTPRDAVGLRAGAFADFGRYGEDIITWRDLGLTYTRAFPAGGSSIVPFVSAGFAVGRTGGSLQSYDTITSLLGDAGIEWLVARYFSLDVHFTGRASRITFPRTWNHQMAGLVLAVAGQLPW